MVSVNLFVLTLGILLGSTMVLGRVFSSTRSGVHSSAKPSAYVKKQAQANSLFNKACSAWRLEHDFAKSEELYRQLFSSYSANPFMRLSYAEMLADNGKDTAAIAQYRLLFPSAPGGRCQGDCPPSVMERYAQLCRKNNLPSEADGVEQQIVLTAGKKFGGYPKVTEDQLATLPIHAMAQLAEGREWQERGNTKKANSLFEKVIVENPHLSLAQNYRGR